MVALWTNETAKIATGGTVTASFEAFGVSIDTRSIAKGDLFVALKAARDGHEFVAQACQNGAAAALVTHRPEGVPEDFPLVIVDDVLVGLKQMGKFARSRSTARIAAVTGSVGKTSTKEMLLHVLARQGKTHGPVASFNNHWGVPLTMARMPQDCDFAVFELGMNHPGEIGPLSKMVQPHAVMITTIAPAHMEAFDGIEGIAAEKASICEGLEKGGAAVLPADVDTINILVQAARDVGATILGFGSRAEEFHLKTATPTQDITVVEARIRGVPSFFKIGTPGRHFASNAMGVLALTEALGADPTRAALDLASWHPPAGRGQRKMICLDPVDDRQTLELIDDAYNANPTSMAAALEVLAASVPRNDLGSKPTGRRIAILGDMLELGVTETQDHIDIASQSELENIDVIHCVGTRMKHLYAALPAPKRGMQVDTAAELAPHIHTLIDAGDVLMIKGSLGSRVITLVDVVEKLGHPKP